MDNFLPTSHTTHDTRRMAAQSEVGSFGRDGQALLVPGYGFSLIACASPCRPCMCHYATRPPCHHARCIGAAGGKRTPFLRMEKQSPSLTSTVSPVTWQPSSGRLSLEERERTAQEKRCDARIIVHTDHEKKSNLVMKSFSLFEIPS
jgi:hypothetical protein